MLLAEEKPRGPLNYLKQNLEPQNMCLAQPALNQPSNSRKDQQKGEGRFGDFYSDVHIFGPYTGETISGSLDTQWYTNLQKSGFTLQNLKSAPGYSGAWQLDSNSTTLFWAASNAPGDMGVTSEDLHSTELTRPLVSSNSVNAWDGSKFVNWEWLRRGYQTSKKQKIEYDKMLTIAAFAANRLEQNSPACILSSVIHMITNLLL